MKRFLDYLYQYDNYNDCGREIYLSLGCFSRLHLIRFNASQLLTDVWTDLLHFNISVGFFNHSFIGIQLIVLSWMIRIDLLLILPKYEKYDYENSYD
mgnify:CR=1 FL=1